ncbi:ABC transporter ATP-binding protein [Papillibacter cinnamivorans]|uniref:NitT/TauT family transport system ATP-binding protein n=1 Tax=Papillibacter cinnamivorans DSM 12816 TaxID=1122930 RepID=A0A1W2A3G5_9FIRM|nr:ATP-binding cassette domain-containing protein [Papillibacter cinnamivorans]SMC55289.1 NitT/TauT family transport system ATP-binding protein [Papillibacter cinnamivorans DSM 12816]
MIEFRNVSVSFGDKPVLSDFTLRLPEEGITCLKGPSGCGKTTLLRVLVGLQEPDAGKVEGVAPGDCAVVFQEDRLLPWKTALQNLTILPGLEEKEALEWLRRVELGNEAGRYPAELSGGMRRRVALVRALAYGGRLLVLDEPFLGMDEELKKRLYPLIRNAGVPVILVTHEEEDIRLLADRVYHFSGPPLKQIGED